MNIMQITSGGGVDGASRHCMMLTRELAARGHQVTLVCRPGAWIGQQLRAEGIHVVFSDLRRWPVDELRRMAAVCQARRMDVIHTHMSRAHFFGVLLRRFSGIPCVATAHNRLLQLHWMLNDQVIACSESTRRFHRRFNLVGRHRIVTIHNFIDFDRFAQVPDAARRKIRREFGLREDARLVGEIGHLCRRKGQIHLVRALPPVLAQFPQTRLLLVGCDQNAKMLPYIAQVKQEARRLGVDDRIIWAGARQDIPEILAVLDLFVLPSLEEGHPLAVLEAMACRTPVVASAVGGLPEMTRSGETGVLVPPADPPALAAAMVRLLGDPDLRCRLSSRAQEMVRRQFSPMSQVPQVEAVLRAAAAQRRSSVDRRAA
jgi:glycosyltransferase involved in cell wall biosynthesis